MATNRDYLFFKSLPPGYRFCPTDEELIAYYLQRKVLNLPLGPNKMKDVNIYKYNPQQLSDEYKEQGEHCMYFFSSRDRKYPKGNRPKRSAGNGYWKATGVDTHIKQKNIRIGSRKALVYYQGNHKVSTKTDWIMYEYKLAEQSTPNAKKRPQNADPNDMKLDDWVLCKIYKKTKRSEKEKEQEQASGNAAGSSSSQPPMHEANVDSTSYQPHMQTYNAHPTQPTQDFYAADYAGFTGTSAAWMQIAAHRNAVDFATFGPPIQAQALDCYGGSTTISAPSDVCNGPDSSGSTSFAPLMEGTYGCNRLTGSVPLIPRISDESDVPDNFSINPQPLIHDNDFYSFADYDGLPSITHLDEFSDGKKSEPFS